MVKAANIFWMHTKGIISKKTTDAVERISLKNINATMQRPMCSTLQRGS
jgi:hypothetical protein